MTTKPQVGRNIYNDAVRRGKSATEKARRALNQIIDDKPGPQTTALLIAVIALSIGEMEAALSELNEIGKNAKNGIKKDVEN